MSGHSALFSRLLFVFALVCAAVSLFIMCSDAARASPITVQVDNGVKHKVLRRLYAPHSQHHPPFTSLPSTETGLQTGTHSETETSRNYRQASSIIDHQSNPQQFTGGSLSYSQNSLDNRQSRTGTNRVQIGVRPASSYHPLSADSYNSYPVIIRKSSHVSPFHQSSSPSQVWDPKDTLKSYIKEKVPRNDSPPLFSSHTGKHWSSSVPTSRGHYSGYKETNELAAAGAPSASSEIQSIGLHLASSSETQRHKKVQSYLFKDSQASFGGHETAHTGGGSNTFPTTPHEQRPSGAQDYSSFSIKQLQQSQRKDPTKEVQHLSGNVGLLYPNANVAQYGAQTDNFAKYQHTSQISLHPVPGKDETLKSFVPMPHADFQGSYATGGKKSGVSSFINTTTSGSIHAHKPGQIMKRIYGFRGFKNPTWRAVKEPSILSSNERTNRRYSFTPKYSFGQREAPMTPAKPGRTTTDYPSPSPGTLDIIQTKTTPRPFISGFKEAQPRLLESDAGIDSRPDRRQFRVYKRIYGLKGFGTRPLEGAKTLVREPDKSARVQQGFEGFKLRSSQLWQQPESSHVSTMSSEDLKPLLKTAGSTRFTPEKYKRRRKVYTFMGFQPLQGRKGIAKQNPTTASPSLRISSAYLRSAGELKMESSPKSEPPNKTRPVAVKVSLFNSSTSSTVRGKRVKGNGKKPNGSTSLTNDTGNAAIVRLPKLPARVIAITYADILGSASYSGVTATQTPIIKDYFPNTTAMTKPKEEAGHWTLNVEGAVFGRENTSRRPEAEDKLDFSSPEENKSAVRSEEVDSDMKASDLFLDNEGSGSGSFNMSDVFSTDATKSQRLSEDLLQLDYLRISTGNISFKSLKLSHGEK